MKIEKNLHLLIYLMLFIISPAALFSELRPELQETLAVIKPDAVEANQIGAIIARFESNGLQVAALKMVKLTKDDAAKFYHIHRERPFYPALIEFMSSGPIVAIALRGEDAVEKSRFLIGATDPAKAAKGTLRGDFGKTITSNALHGSDSGESAREEIAFLFTAAELAARK